MKIKLLVELSANGGGDGLAEEEIIRPLIEATIKNMFNMISEGHTSLYFWVPTTVPAYLGTWAWLAVLCSQH